MTSIENVFEQLEEQGIVFKSANNLLHISIDASDYLDIKREAKQMHKQEIIDASNGYTTTELLGVTKGEYYYQETFVSKGSDECQFEATTNTSSATICKQCGREKYLHKT